MKTEFEAKFIQIDPDDIRQRLTTVGASLSHPMRLMRRLIIETPPLKAKNAYIRLRDEGDKTTLTYKQFDALAIDGAKELEVVVSDFQTTADVLAAAGLMARSYQESRRETWKLEEAEIVLDEWPWLDPYLEIEAAGPEKVKAAAHKLGLKWVDAQFGDVMVAYRAQYPHLSDTDTIGDLAQVVFDQPLPQLFQGSVDQS